MILKHHCHACGELSDFNFEFVEYEQFGKKCGVWACNGSVGVVINTHHPHTNYTTTPASWVKLKDGTYSDPEQKWRYPELWPDGVECK